MTRALIALLIMGVAVDAIRESTEALLEGVKVAETVEQEVKAAEKVEQQVKGTAKVEQEEPLDEKAFALIEANKTTGCTYNGAYDNCKSWCPCGHGEGDCDSDSDCQPGLRCAHEVGAQFGMRANVDVCMGGMMGGGMQGGMMGGGMQGGMMGGGMPMQGGMMGGGMPMQGGMMGGGMPMQGGMMGGGMPMQGGMMGGMHGGMPIQGGMMGGDRNFDGVHDALQGGGRCNNGCVYCPAGTHDQFTCQPNMQACGYNGFFGEVMEHVDHCN